ncbi:reverse transcriptase [Senna tora]|uniref:Reverse transcriptase n=1 Tax=Senna tora TaxID=362788 RepID=A0A834TJ54_9FABA|nr:reverse transcriptase [Senna tora]
MGYDHYVGTNMEGRSGGTILAWNQATTCKVFEVSKHWIHASAISREGTEFFFTCVYGHPRLSERVVLWDFLHQKASVINSPWLIFGDFNQISSLVEKLSNSSSIVGADTLKAFLDNDALIDLHAQGNCHVQQQVTNLNEELHLIQQSLVSFDYPPLNLLREKEVRKDLEDKLAKEEILWAQKARQLWLVEGDRNTKYFYAIVKKRRMINQFTRIRNLEGEWTQDYSQMEMLAVQYFRDVYNYENKPQREDIDQFLNSLEVPCITNEEKLSLTTPLSSEEIEHALFLMKPDKAHGPDGLPPMFFQRFWPVVKDELIASVKSFFDRGYLLKELNQTLITIIPKNQCPEQFKDFRPITLCNVIVKIISIVLVIRMQPLMQRVIAPNQNGFVKGRAISDSILLASELMTFIHKARITCCAFKLDIQKAYDKLSWDFLEAVLIKMAFPHQEEKDKNIQRIQFDRRGPRISHLMYADDTILFFKADNQNCNSVRQVLGKYATLVGHVLNKDKSIVIFSPNTHRHFKRTLANTLGANISNKLGKYLGVRVDNRVNSADLLKELIEKMEQKFAGWKSRLLSRSGRLTLIKYVLQSSPIYQISVKPIPKAYANRIDALSTNFYWGHHDNNSKMHLAPK